MSLSEIFGLSGGGLLIILSFIKIPKIEINFWGWLFKKIGKFVNQDMMDRIDTIEDEIKAVKDDVDSYKETAKIEQMQTIRYRILRFNDEILHERKHTEEHFNEILVYIDEYEDFCKTHPTYPNTKAELAIENIKRIYKKCLEERAFLS